MPPNPFAHSLVATSRPAQTVDARHVGALNEHRILEVLHRFGGLRTQDVKALIWPGSKDIRVAQLKLAKMLGTGRLLKKTMPNNSVAYTLSATGATALAEAGVPEASSGKDIYRRLEQFDAMNLVNEACIEFSAAHGPNALFETRAELQRSRPACPGEPAALLYPGAVENGVLPAIAVAVVGLDVYEVSPATAARMDKLLDARFIHPVDGQPVEMQVTGVLLLRPRDAFDQASTTFGGNVARSVERAPNLSDERKRRILARVHVGLEQTPLANFSAARAKALASRHSDRHH